ncbi:RolB family protein [Agrobacterium vitis]|uniref:RolB family protein n=1 Tax=Agrobacterium vitis TaxID=373 RepID=UPI0012E7DE97|nr:RolB family protein [Agrobacterium vitis]MVA53131.1 E protein [Agrobacterium vitis]MVA63185.1 E protein [Agrobacterium vitis]
MVPPPRPGFVPLSLESIDDRMEMHLLLISACILYHIYVRDNLMIYQEILTKYLVGGWAESALKDEISALYLRFPFSRPLTLQSLARQEVICKDAAPIYVYCSRDAMLSHVQSKDLCQFGRANLLACTLAPYRTGVTIEMVRCLFKRLRDKIRAEARTEEEDLSHFVAFLPTTSFRQEPGFCLGGESVQFFLREGGLELPCHIIAFGRALFSEILADGSSCDWKGGGESARLHHARTSFELSCNVPTAETTDTWAEPALRADAAYPVRPPNLTPAQDHPCEPLLSGNRVPNERHKVWKRFFKKFQEKRRSVSKLFHFNR